MERKPPVNMRFLIGVTRRRTLDVVTKNLAMTLSTTLSETLNAGRCPSQPPPSLPNPCRNAPCHLFHVQTCRKSC
jgi:hypothetical protein